MLDRRRCAVYDGVDETIFRISEEGGIRSRRRSDDARYTFHTFRWNSAVGRPVILVVLVVQDDRRAIPRPESQGGIYPPTLQVDAVAVRPAVLEHRRDACTEIGRDLAVNVDDSALMIEASHFHGRFVVGREVSLLGDAIKDASGTAAAESQRRRALQHLEPLGVIQVAKNLGVVANPVDEEVCGRGVLTAYGYLVSVAFALVNFDSRHVFDDIADVLTGLVFDFLVGDDRNRLRNVAERRVGLCCAA